MRVFHIISRLDVGGAERVAMNIAAAKDNNVEQHIVELMRGNSPFTSGIIEELRKSGTRCHRSIMPVLFHWHYLAERMIACLFPLRMAWLWLRYRPDVVHCHTEMPDMAIWLSLRLMPWMKIKVVRTIHNTVLWSGMENVGPRVERFMQQQNANIAISGNVQRCYDERFHQQPPIIYNGVNPVEQKVYDGIKKDKINICFAGRLEEQKGIDVLCKIIRSLADDKRFYFHIFGSGRLQSLVNEELSSLDNVSINAPLHGISSFMSSFDYLIMPSRHEGLSILAIEASMNGLPLLINHCDGLTDTLPDNWPLAVDNNDLGQWTNLFRYIIPSVNKEELKNEAKAFAMSHFSMQEMQKKYMELYQ